MSTISTDVLVVGGGPAGLAAATELKRQGIGQVTLVEREGVTGGIPRHCAHSPYGMREFSRVLSGGRYAERLTSRARDAGVDLRIRHSVVGLGDGHADIATPDGALRIDARRIVLATGIRETSRAGRLISGQRPIGILTTGALQDYVHLRGLAPFRRPVIVGSELVTMSALLTCRDAGIRPVALVEDEGFPRVGLPLGLFPHLLGLPVHYRTSIDDIFGTDRVEAVRLRDHKGVTRIIECDGVLFTGRFTPESSLARLAGLAIDRGTGGPAIGVDGRTSAGTVFAAGNVLRAVKTAGHCWSEGVRVGRAVARSLAGA
jgi:thioredoxin reductase